MGPTSFDSSMFPQGGATSLDSPATSSIGPPAGDESYSSKSHKAKKKKKKNKHKHKHKHKHDKSDKDKPMKLDKTPISSIILEHPLSSDASNVNSPVVQAPSSPEFEVI